MKIPHHIRVIMLLSVFIMASAWPVTAGDTKKELKDTATGRKSSDATFDGARNVPPVEVQKSSGTRTQEQAIKEFKDSGPANPGPKSLKTKEVPSPK